MTNEYKGRYVIIGPPGTGKTHRVAKSVERICNLYDSPVARQLGRVPAVVCSLTVTAAREAAGRVDLPKGSVGTLHSMAYQSIGAPPVIEGDSIKEWNESHPDCTIGISNSPDDLNIGIRQENSGGWRHDQYQILRSTMTDKSQWPETVVSFAEEYEQYKTDLGVIDFTDMIQLALNTTDKAPGEPNVLIVDEAQDLSALEFALAMKWGDAAGASIMVGDPYQSLYGWRGANPDYLLSPESGKRDVLKKSYRVPRQVANLAKSVIVNLSGYEEIEYEPRDEEGSFERCGGTWTDPDPIVHAALDDMEEGRKVIICGSCGYMLDHLIERLSVMGVPFWNPWRPHTRTWNPLHSENGETRGQVILAYLAEVGAGLKSGRFNARNMYRWVRHLRAKGLLLRGAKTWLESLADQESEIMIDKDEIEEIFNPDDWGKLASIFAPWIQDPNKAGVLRDSIEGMMDWFVPRTKDAQSFFYPAMVAINAGTRYLAGTEGEGKVDNRPLLSIGTIHSFKGAESDSVYVLPDLSSTAYRGFKEGGTNADAVYRMFYVAITRARMKVSICTPSGRNHIDI